LRQEAYKAQQTQRTLEKEEKKRKKDEELLQAQKARKISLVARQEVGHGPVDPTATALDLSKVPVQDIFKRLRAKGQPIRLFGESEQERWRRLGRVEASDDRELGQKNDFKALMEATEEEMELLKHYGLASKDSAGTTTIKPKKLKDIDNPEYEPERIRSELLSSDPELLHRLISVYFKRLHKEWERKLQERPDEERLTDDVYCPALRCITSTHQIQRTGKTDICDLPTVTRVHETLLQALKKEDNGQGRLGKDY
jgi:pre-mRNA-splicing factor 18